MAGDNAAGVFVQSVGGGGGVIGKSGDLLGLDPMFQGTAGGVGLAANVGIIQDHDVTATGLNSVALLAQSAGGTGNGNIDVTVTAGTTITGGTGTGAGVGFLDGATNLLTNRGTITSVNQIGGFAVTATGGNETVDNFGTMIGSVNLGAGANAFNNKSTALFNMGAVDPSRRRKSLHQRRRDVAGRSGERLHKWSDGKSGAVVDRCLSPRSRFRAEHGRPHQYQRNRIAGGKGRAQRPQQVADSSRVSSD